MSSTTPAQTLARATLWFALLGPSLFCDQVLAARDDDAGKLAWETRNEITLMAGYRIADDLEVSSDLESTDPNQSDQGTLSLDETTSFTLIYDRTYRKRPNTQLEIYLSRQRTTLDTSEPFQNGEDFDLDVYYAHAGGTYLFREQGAVPFVAGTLGITHMRPTDTEYNPETRFSLRIGGGVKLPLAKHVGLRLEASGLLTYFDTNTAIFCSGGCVARVEGSAFTQVDLGAGLVIAF
jgi:hypothetical protein